MKTQKFFRHVGGASLVGMGLVLLASGTAEGQRVIAGFPRSDQTDVTGPSVTSGDQLASFFAEPGTVLSMYCPVAWGVRTTGEIIQTRLASAELRPAIMVGGRELNATAQLLVLNLMTSEDDDELEGRVLGALVTNNDRGAMSAARRLVARTVNLLTVMSEVDPADPGEEAATRLSRAVSAYNAFVDASSPVFLVNQPDELRALHAVLNQLVIASLENEDRDADVDVVDSEGLACAIPFTPPPPAPPPPPPPVEQAIQMCVWVNGEFRMIAAVRRPETGDTMVILNGDRQPLVEVYPTAVNVPTATWVPLGEPVTIGTAQYQPFGVSRTVEPGELTLRGTVNGFDFYVDPDAPATPTVVYFLAGPQCEVQPYRAVETIRVRG